MNESSGGGPQVEFNDEAKKQVLLHFQTDIVENALDSPEGGLYVLAPGLGTTQLVAVLLKLQDEKKKYDSKAQVGVTIVIGADHTQREALQCELERIHPRKDWFLSGGVDNSDKQECANNEQSGPKISILRHVTADVPTAERLRLYECSSCLCVTTRILVVDILSGRLDPNQVSGLIIMNAHNVSESSGEGFVVKLYRTKGGTGFVRAFSENPVAFTSDFAKSEKVLKALHCKNLQLWPRFRTAVQDDFEGAAPELVEVSVCADPGASIIYECIAELLDTSVKELKKHEKLDATDLSPSQGLTSAFDETVKRQLAPVWHTVPPKIRQLVDDMRTLRSLANYLLKFDAVTFFRYLENLRSTDGTKSAWMFHSASHIIFEAAKKRVYENEPKENTIKPVLEELPKWRPLVEIVEEIMDEQDCGSSCTYPAKPILVFCEDEYTCEQLRHIVRPDGAKDYMELVYLQYLASKTSSSKKGGGKRRARKRPLDTSLANQLEQNALRKEAKEFAALQSVGELEHKSNPKARKEVSETRVRDKVAAWFEENTVFLPSNTSGALQLWSYEPDRIIVYDPDVALIRQIELYTAQNNARRVIQGDANELENPRQTIRVYLLRYEPSPELDKFHARLVRERKAFEDLIKSKGSMALNITSNNDDIRYTPVERADNSAAANSITRKGGGRNAQMQNRVRLVVDVREFMSSLPAVLYSQAYSLVPVTLEVGDYVLCPEICVERKTIPDLRGSLHSGRLYHQAEAMCKHYSIAILLIEFDGEKAFALQSPAELGVDIQSGHIMSRLVLLCLHHPRLRLVWSRSLHATADIFRQLKANYDEPDPAVCQNVGVSDGNIKSNSAALEMLRRVPGVNESNFRAIAKEAGSIAGLCTLSSETLQRVMGAVAGARLWEFLHVPKELTT
jgi:DNA excision repair protein ERCC-4